MRSTVSFLFVCVFLLWIISTNLLISNGSINHEAPKNTQSAVSSVADPHGKSNQ